MDKTWWIIIAIIVVILILILIAVWQGKRRTVARRGEAQQLRDRAKDNEGTVVESRHRAESAAEQAERARAEAEAKQKQADLLEAEAQHEQKTAAAVERDHAETLREADRLDPDTPTDRHGNRVEGSGSRGDRAGESRIDSDTGQPVGEAARQGNVRADRPGAEANGPAGHGQQDDRFEGTVGHDRSVAYDQQQEERPDGALRGSNSHDERRETHPESAMGSGDGRPTVSDGEQQDEQQGAPESALNNDRSGVDDQQRDVRPESDSHDPSAMSDRPRSDSALPASEDGADESDGTTPRDNVNRLFGRHARNTGPDDGADGATPTR